MKGRTNAPSDAWRHVHQLLPDECWFWTGSIDSHGYGRFSIAGKNALAHRIVYELATGESPGDLLVCHTCDERRCCNPAHLFLGTPLDNTLDMVAKGRQRVGNVELTEVQVREVRRLADDGHPQRAIAARFGITQPNVGYIVRRETWRKVA